MRQTDDDVTQELDVTVLDEELGFAAKQPSNFTQPSV